MAIVNTRAFGAMMKDFYPLPGTRLKQYVVDMRRESLWERTTAPLVDVATHEDNTGGDPVKAAEVNAALAAAEQELCR